MANYGAVEEEERSESSAKSVAEEAQKKPKAGGDSEQDEKNFATAAPKGDLTSKSRVPGQGNA